MMADNINVTAAPPANSPSGNKSLSAATAAEVKTAQPLRDTQEASKAAAGEASLSVEELKVAIEQLNEFMKQDQRSLSFSVDESVDEVVVRVVDTETQELIRQIPNEETLKFKQHLEGMLGMLFSDKA